MGDFEKNKKRKKKRLWVKQKNLITTGERSLDRVLLFLYLSCCCLFKRISTTSDSEKQPKGEEKWKKEYTATAAADGPSI